MAIALNYASPHIKRKRSNPSAGYTAAGWSVPISLYSAIASLGSAHIVKYHLGCGMMQGNAENELALWCPIEIAIVGFCYFVSQRSNGGVAVARISFAVAAGMWAGCWVWTAWL